eukprot:gene19493-21418_t
MSGIGRGGRGALLLKALEKPVKLPGQASPDQAKLGQPPGQPSKQQEEQKPPIQPSIPQASAPSQKPAAGRGISMELVEKHEKGSNLLSQMPKSSASPQVMSPPTQQLSSLSLDNEVAKATKRMEKGTEGTEIPLAVNYVPLKCKSNGFSQYAVSFSPDVESINMRRRMLNEHCDVVGKTKSFDGGSLLLLNPLDSNVTILESTRITDGAKITITITFVKKLTPGDRQCTFLYNRIFRNIMRILGLCQIGRYYYSSKGQVSIPQHKLELWPGYITSIEHYEGGLMLLADVSHRLLRMETTLQFMYDLYQKKPQNFQNNATKALVGSIVLTRYNNRTYRIDDIAWDKNPQATFVAHNGEPMRYVDYYKTNYNQTLSDLEQPLLIHRPKPKKGSPAPVNEVICLIPELCSMTGLTDEIRSDFRVMKDISAHTRVSPAQREESMLKFVSNVYSNPEATAELANWGLELDRAILQTRGRVLPNEKIIFGSKEIFSNREVDWSREIGRESVISGVNLNNWLVVFTKRDESKALEFYQTFAKVTTQMGFSVAQPNAVQLKDERTETYLQTIRQNLNPNVQIVVTIFPTSRDDRYAAVKKLCCIESPVPSQCINARTIGQPNKLRSITQKIALQINCKLGGELWALEIPLRSVMIVGIDVYHDAGKGGRSIGAFVASTNQQVTRWFSRVCFQKPGQELIDELKVIFAAALRKFHELNHDLPERIIVYRDGVGDGQLNVVSTYEVQQLSECFALFGPHYQPKMAVIVVQKRINTRIFAVAGNQKLDNPPPGTVLDHSVTRKDWFDFFLVSQHVRQGTVTPTHYVVVHDESGLKADHLQRLSYKLTHLYYNWPGTVRVPAPCQYAHKLAYLVGCSLHQDPDLKLSDRLFFL